METPSLEAIARAQEARAHLVKLKDANRDSGDNTCGLAEELVTAVDALKSLDYGVIRKDKFNLTPEGVYDDLVRSLHDAAGAMTAEQARRKRWLAGDVLVADGPIGPNVAVPASIGADVHGCDPDAYARPQNNRRPRDWATAVKDASLVHIDEMRTLLEMHYDEGGGGGSAGPNDTRPANPSTAFSSLS